MNPEETQKSDPPSVTIPYFLYEAMARSYYMQERNVDIPVPAQQPDPVLPSNEGNMNLKDLYFNPLDIPSNWKPGGVAPKENLHVSPKIQTPEEET